VSTEGGDGDGEGNRYGEKEEKKRGGGRVGRTREFIFLPRFSPYNSHLLCQLVEDGSSEGFIDQPASQPIYQPASGNWPTKRANLKGPKHEKFVAGIFTQIRPVDELETRSKTSKNEW
jgi:hypothetical protein